MLDNGGTENPAVQASLKDHSDKFRNVPQSAAWIIYPVAEDVDGVFTDPTTLLPWHTHPKPQPQG